MRCHRLIAIVLVVAAGAFAADPTILRRHVPDVPPQPENLTVAPKARRTGRSSAWAIPRRSSLRESPATGS